jgi:hypothetical protein
MNMVRHHHPGAEFVKAPLAWSDQTRFSRQIRGVGIREPERTRGAPMRCQPPRKSKEHGSEGNRSFVFAGTRRRLSMVVRTSLAAL